MLVHLKTRPTSSYSMIALALHNTILIITPKSHYQSTLNHSQVQQELLSRDCKSGNQGSTHDPACAGLGT